MLKDHMTLQDTAVRALSDGELDTVNGGLLPLAFAAGFLAGAAWGYALGKAAK